jgi:hypothetical protein
MTRQKFGEIPLAEQMSPTILAERFALQSDRMPDYPSPATVEVAWNAVELGLNQQTVNATAEQYLEVGEQLASDYRQLGNAQGPAATLYAAIPLLRSRRFGFNDKSLASAWDRLQTVGSSLLEQTDDENRQRSQGALRFIAFSLASIRNLKTDAAPASIYYPVSRREKSQYTAYRISQPEGRRIDPLRLRAGETGNPSRQSYRQDFSLVEEAAKFIADSDPQKQLTMPSTPVVEWIIREAGGETVPTKEALVLDGISMAIGRRRTLRG